MKTFVVITVVVLGIVGGTITQQIVNQPIIQSSATTIPAVAPVVLAPMTQIVSPCSFGTPIQITVVGTPLAGTYLACEGHSGVATTRCWAAGFTTANGDTSGTVFVERQERLDPISGLLIPNWAFTAMIGPVASRPGGAFAGKVWSPEATLGGMFPMNGPDFNVTGTADFVGTPSYGAGGIITVTVSP